MNRNSVEAGCQQKKRLTKSNMGVITALSESFSMLTVDFATVLIH